MFLVLTLLVLVAQRGTGCSMLERRQTVAGRGARRLPDDGSMVLM